MKKAVILIAIVAILISCNKNTKSEDVENTTTENSMSDTQKEELFACPMHPEVTGKKGGKCLKCGMELTEPVAQKEHDHTDGTHDHTDAATSEEGAQETNTYSTPFSTSVIVDNYLKIKNALTKDDANGAAKAGKALYQTFNSINANSLTASQKKEYLDIADDAKEHAEHIGDNAGKIDHQREHFVLLSKDVSDLIATFGTNQKLYLDFCPMADNNKGAVWISETKEITNPYFGKDMATCGSIKKEF